MKQLETIKELINQGDINKAIEALDALLTQTDFAPKDEVYYLRGNAYRKQGNWQQALNKEVNMKGYNYAWQVKEDTCNGCSSCATVCPDGCISVYKVKVE